MSEVARVSGPNQRYTSTGKISGYYYEIYHPGLKRNDVVFDRERDVARNKMRARCEKMELQWNKICIAQQKKDERENAARDKESKKQLAIDKTIEAEKELDNLDNILNWTLSIDDTVNWELLKDNKPFPEAKPEKPSSPTITVKPPYPDEPLEANFHVRLSFIDKLFSKRKIEKEIESKELYDKAIQDWNNIKERIDKEHKESIIAYNSLVDSLEVEYKSNIAEWEEKKQDYEKEQNTGNKKVDERKQSYMSQDPQAIVDYVEMVLENSTYPDYMEKKYDVDYNKDNKMIIIDYKLPVKDCLPSTKSVSYIVSRDEFQEKHIPESQQNRIFDSVAYQISLRTIHEIFESDSAEAIDTVVFNGFIDYIDPATGQEATVCLLTIQTSKEEFLKINLANIDPKACFKNLKGISAARLYGISPVAPIVNINKEDKRFISSYDVTDQLDVSYNLAAMPWEDFEHLIRELFQEEFSTTGGEVKVTQASRDGGVDAIAFDPDPIRGGKIVIQAKRYTNTVGVSAVRDLYGTVMNEGANKGVLVTTSDYGTDAHMFAKDKPLVLINGANLLHLLEKHGHKAKIDLQEAKLLASKE